MYNLYFISSNEIPLTHLKTENVYEIPFMLKEELLKIDPNSDNYILISIIELPTYELKGIGEK